jgi:predicted transglutaminase-like cysteine proteinase
MRMPTGPSPRDSTTSRPPEYTAIPLVWSLITAIIIGMFVSTLCTAGEFTLTKQAITRIYQEHGKYAGQRVENWQELIRSSAGLSDLQKLRRVNNFFNALEFVNDIDHWGKKDYWATPLETLISNGGDCEDFSIAKYFTLLEMGIPAEKMRLTYVMALRLNQAHMVLTYFPSPEDDPLVLDNLDKKISPAAMRDDLQPVYSFNGDGLWLAKKRLADSKQVGRADRLAPWREVIARISDELGQQATPNHAFKPVKSYTASNAGDAISR